MVSKIFTSVSLVFLISGNCWAASEPIQEVSVYSAELRQELETLRQKSFLIFDEKDRLFINGWGRGLELINKLAYEGRLAELAHALSVDPLRVDCKTPDGQCYLDGKYPLQAALDGVADSVWVQAADCVKCMKLLIKCGAEHNIEWRGCYFGKLVEIPLIFRAAVIKKFDAVAVLLAAGTDVTMVDRYGHSIFFWFDMVNPCRNRSSQEDRIKLEIKKLLVGHFITLLSAVAQRDDLDEFVRLFNFFITQSRISVPELQGLLESPSAQNITNYLRDKQTGLKLQDWLVKLIGE